MRIDVHAHHLPADYMALLQEGGGPSRGASHDASTLDRMVEAQDVAGIDRQILSTGPNAPYLRDETQAARAARLVNDRFADIVASRGERFGAFGALPLPHPDAARREAVRCLDELGLAGINLGCSTLGQALDDPALEDLWRELDARSAVLYVHPGGMVVGSEPLMPYMDDTLIAVTLGSATEIASVALRLAGICRRFRNVRPIIGLLGGSLPFLLQRVLMIVGKWPLPSALSAFQDPAELVAELRRFRYDVNLLPDPHVLEAARRAYGIENLVFGSDAPSSNPTSALQFLRAANFTEKDVETILAENPARLFAAPT